MDLLNGEYLELERAKITGIKTSVMLQSSRLCVSKCHVTKQSIRLVAFRGSLKCSAREFRLRSFDNLPSSIQSNGTNKSGDELLVYFKMGLR